MPGRGGTSNASPPLLDIEGRLELEKDFGSGVAGLLGERGRWGDESDPVVLKREVKGVGYPLPWRLRRLLLREGKLPEGVSSVPLEEAEVSCVRQLRRFSDGLEPLVCGLSESLEASYFLVAVSIFSGELVRDRRGLRLLKFVNVLERPRGLGGLWDLIVAVALSSAGSKDWLRRCCSEIRTARETVILESAGTSGLLLYKVLEEGERS